MALNRRQFVTSALTLPLLGSLGVKGAVGQDAPAATLPIVLHQTDLFHPHGDPDDHFDLAVVFALAKRGAIDFRGVILDYPPQNRIGGPDVMGVAQMSRIASFTPHTVVGGNVVINKRDDACLDLPKKETAAIDYIIAELERAESPVRILIAGSATDVAIASSRRPDLFEAKCAGVYLNAGSAYPNPDKPGRQEYNVALNPSAYATLFDLPCPLYWFPCWHRVEDWISGENSAYYLLPHDKAFEGTSDELNGFFAYMLERSNDTHWVKALSKPSDKSWNNILKGKRNMWCTASQLLLAGLSATRDGEIVEQTPEFDRSSDALFRMENIEAVCDDAGNPTWKYVDRETNRKILHVLDPDAYPVAMARAINALFRTL